jgi:hypothetical protein
MAGRVGATTRRSTQQQHQQQHNQQSYQQKSEPMELTLTQVQLTGSDSEQQQQQHLSAKNQNELLQRPNSLMFNGRTGVARLCYSACEQIICKKELKFWD